MNKLFFSLTILLLLFCSCTKVDVLDNQDGNEMIAFGIDGVTPLPKAVDLGLTVNGHKLLWASFNLGASKPEEYGDCYAWGELEKKTNDYNWSTYKWAANGADHKVTKYCTNKDEWGGNGEPDNKSVLDLVDDVAHVKLGGNWRMPTWEEWESLISLCNFVWTKKNNVIGIYISGPNGNSIFLPTSSGFWNIPNSCWSDGIEGYWSSSISGSGGRYAWSLFCYTGNAWKYGYYRQEGFSIRPVYEDN